MSDVVRPSQYEFNEAQNQVFRDLGKRMTTVGTLTMVFGGLTLLAAVIASARGGGGGVVSGVLWLVFGSWTQTAGKSFTAIATTEGSDVDHLMTAVGQLGKLYKAMYRMLITGLVIAVLIFVVTMALVAQHKI